MRAAVAAFGFVVLLAGQSAAQPATFTASANLVTVPVLVTTGDGSAHVQALTQGDFKILENGKQQTISVFTQERAPVSICIVLDSSGSMNEGHQRGLAIQASQALIANLAPDDELALVVFSEKASLVVPWTLGSSAPTVNWDGWRPGGSTSLMDAVQSAFTTIEKARNPQRLIVLITDGFENSSRLVLKDLVKTRRQSEATVYGFGVGLEEKQNSRLPSSSIERQTPPRMGEMYPGAAPPPLPIDHLDVLSADTGGSMFRLQNPGQVTRAVNRLF